MRIPRLWHKIDECSKTSSDDANDTTRLHCKYVRWLKTPRCVAGERTDSEVETLMGVSPLTEFRLDSNLHCKSNE